MGVPIADRLEEFAEYHWTRFAGPASLIAFVRSRVQCYWVASVIVPRAKAGESEMALMQNVNLGLRQPWFASKAQAPGRQNSSPIHDACRTRAARSPIRHTSIMGQMQ